MRRRRPRATSTRARLGPCPNRPAGAAQVLTADDLVPLTGGRLLRAIRAARSAAPPSTPGSSSPGSCSWRCPASGPTATAPRRRASSRGRRAPRLADPSGPASRARRLGDVTVVRVPDALAALGPSRRLAARFDPLVVGVTGSIAKTSTKEAIAAVLGARCRTLRNEGNQNNEIGLPLTLLRLGPEHEAAVLEMGMYVGGEIADLARDRPAAIGVVTAVQACTCRGSARIDAIERAKGELVEALPPPTARRVLNADDPTVRRMAERTRAPRVLTLRVRRRRRRPGDEDVVARASTACASRSLRRAAAAIAMTIPALGQLSVHNALAGAAVGLAAGLDLADDRRGPRAAAGPRRTAARSIRRGRRDAHRRQLQRLARLGDGGAGPARRAARAAASPSSARCSSWARATTTGHRERRGGRGRRGDLLVVVGRRRAGDRRRRARGAASTASRIHRGRRSRRGARPAPAAAPRRRRRPRQGVARRRARPARRRARRAPRAGADGDAR